MYLVIDNYDSFVHNLARYFEIEGIETVVRRNDVLNIQDIHDLQPEAIILSPGPRRPQDSGLCIEIIKQLGEHIPILGVCLGHQAIGEAFGALISETKHVMHGKSSSITHNNSALFTNISSPFQAGRYHSLIIDKTTVPETLDITAQSEDNIIMAIQHRSWPVYGVQFHPESILTPQGHDIVRNFILIAQEFYKQGYRNDLLSQSPLA